MDLAALVQRHLHPLLTHFPIVLLLASVALDAWGRRQPAARWPAWLALLAGTIAALPAVVSGLIAHEPYERTAAIGAIDRHEQLAFLTTAVFIGLTIWRWRTRRQAGAAPASWLYLALALVGLGLLAAVGLTGGELVFSLGVGVKELVR